MFPLRVVVFLILTAYISVITLSQGIIAQQATSKTYIVHVSDALRPSVFATAQEWYKSALAAVRGLHSPDIDENMHGLMYNYGYALHGFAARLTPTEAEALKLVRGVLSVVEDGILQLQTTRTPEFMGLSSSHGIWPASKYGEDVIIGVIDTGIWPRRQSFDDKMMGPVPSRWKGGCVTLAGFRGAICNRKIIGAKSFSQGYQEWQGPINETIEYRSVLDGEGHGTHTASTAAGAFVSNANLSGQAPGTARGMAPYARIAVYKACWIGGCFYSDIVAAFEEAIMDGVDIISLSVGGGVLPYEFDPIAIASYGAMENGILVSASAGNFGPSPQSVTNISPWILTVGASTIDRNFPAVVILANNASYTGASLYNGKGLGSKQLPLIYAGDAGLSSTNESVRLCIPGLLDPARVKGKIVLCDRGLTPRVAKGIAVKEAGGAGMILANGILNGEELLADSHLLPALIVGYSEGNAIRDYITKTASPMGSIRFQGTIYGVKPAPVIASFSSRGPSAVTPEILKPDVTAPGVNILAAWTSRVGPTGEPDDNRVVDFNIISGTSMSCPHVSGLAALVKSVHHNWSPAAIKSALMTTSYDLDNTGNIILQGEDSNHTTPFAYGSGHVNPNAALDPGLIYDLHIQDYVDFLCSLNYSDGILTLFTKGRYNCSKAELNASDLNYPSLSVAYNQSKSPNFTSTVMRTVTNVGAGESVYRVVVRSPPGVVINVEPSTLSFSQMNEKKTYTITCKMSAKLLSPGETLSLFGSLTWSDSKHVVRSPISLTWQS